MHILLIHQAFVGLDEAGGTRHIEMAQALHKFGHQVTVISGATSYLTGKARPHPASAPGDSVQYPGIRVLQPWSFTALHRSFFHRLLSFISFMVSSFITGLGVRNVDVVWGTSPPLFQAFGAWLLAFLKRKPFLFEVRDLWPAFAVAMGVLNSSLLISASQWLERFLYRRAMRLVVNSPGFIPHVSKHGARDVRLVPNGVDPAMFDPAGDGHALREQNELGNSFCVLYAGAHGAANDLDVVIEAAAFLKDFHDIQIVMVGDGKEKPRLQELTQIMGLQNIKFLPAVPKLAMGEVLAAANACLAILKPLELYKTTYPNKVFDYMAAGRPVILAIDGAIREVVEGAGAGIFTPPGDARRLAEAVLALHDDPEMAHRMGLAGRKAVEEHFNRDQIARQMLDVFLEINNTPGN